MEENSQSSRKFCVSCGASYEVGATFCPKCGMKVQAPASINTQPAPIQTPVAQPLPPPSGKSNNATKVVAVVVVAVVAVIILAALASSLGSSNNGGGKPYVPKANVQYVSATFSQDPISGDVTLNVKVTNTGDAIGSKTIHVSIQENSGTYTNTKTVSLAPGETTTYEVVVNTPFGTGVTSGMIDVWLT